MKASPYDNDLVVLVADKDMEVTMAGLLTRPHALRIHAVSYRCVTHPYRDSGCLLDAHDFLRPFIRSHAHALVLLDREGCGGEQRDRAALEAEIEQRLAQSGWLDRSAAVVLDPELEVLVWSDSPEVDQALGWAGRQPDLRTWLRDRSLLSAGAWKPVRPKETLAAALRQVRQPRSPVLFQQLAQSVSFARCTDPAFAKIQTTLQTWFSPP